MTIRVLIADDHSVVRAGVKALLEAEPDLEVVGETADASTTLSETARTLPDVVVLDLDMPGATGTSVVERLHDDVPSSRIVVLSMHATPGHVREACRRGASGYVAKDCADTDLIDAIRVVSGGRTYVNAALGARLAQDRDPLSARESEVARLLAHGYTNTEIAERLGISVRTTEAHRAHAMAKLGLATRAELVRYALAQGILGSEPGA